MVKHTIGLVSLVIPLASFSAVDSISIGSKSYNSTIDEMTNVYGKINASKKIEVNDVLSLNFDGALKFNVGREQNRFEAESNKFGLSLNEATVKLNVTDELQFKAGAFRQNSNPFLTDDTSFPGLEAQVAFSRVNFVGRVSIPTSESLNIDRKEKEELPYYSQAALNTEFEYVANFKVEAGAYQFKNLPSVVASKSRQFGNTIEGLFDSNAKFTHEFKGLFSNIEITKNLGKTNITGAYKYLENNSAPSDSANSTVIELGADHLISDSRIGLVGGYFYAESDVSPGYYNSPLYGQNNRQGFSAEVSYEELNKYKVKAKYIDADVINANATQKDLTVVMVELEVLSELF